MGYKGIEKEYQLNVIVDRIIGDNSDTFTYDNVEFYNNAIINEDTIKELSKQLKDLYPEHIRNNLWFPLKFYVDDYTRGSLRYIVDEIVDDDNLLRIIGNYYYNESDRQEIVIDELEASILRFIEQYNLMAKPFKWTYKGVPLAA